MTTKLLGYSKKSSGSRAGIPRYTPKEAEIITKHISAEQGNITVACEKASKEIYKSLGIQRTPSALCAYWNAKIRPQLDLSGTPAFALASKGSLILNRKNAPRKHVEDDEILSVHDIVGAYTPRMSKEQKLDLVKFILENQ